MVSKRTDDRFVGGGSCSSCSNACFVVVVVELHEGAELVELGRVKVDLQVGGLLVFTVPGIKIAGLSSWIRGDMFVDCWLLCQTYGRGTHETFVVWLFRRSKEREYERQKMSGQQWKQFNKDTTQRFGWLLSTDARTFEHIVFISRYSADGVCCKSCVEKGCWWRCLRNRSATLKSKPSGDLDFDENVLKEIMNGQQMIRERERERADRRFEIGWLLSHARLKKAAFW